MAGLMASWRYPLTQSGRDLRLDMLRGYFVMVMTINHVGFFPAWTQVFTGGNRLWVSAAEGFIIVSGIVFGMVYRVRRQELGWDWCIKKVFRRSGQLYVVTVIGQLVYYTGDYLLRAVWGRPSNISTSYFDLIFNALFQVRNRPPQMELLTLYVLLLPLGLVAVYLLEQHRGWWLLAGSCFLWQVRLLDRGTLIFFRTGFNLASWQPLFVLGLMGGYYRDELRRWWGAQTAIYRQSGVIVLLGVTAVILITSYQIAFNDLFSETAWLQLDGPVFLKSVLAPGRLIASFAVFVGFLSMTSLLWMPLRRLLGWLLLPLGQHALIAYVLHTIPVYLIHRLPRNPTPFGSRNPVTTGFMHVFILLLVWQFTCIIARWQTIQMRPQPKKTAVFNHPPG